MWNGFVKPGDILDGRYGVGGNPRGVYFHIPNEVFSRQKNNVSRNLKNLPDLIVLNADGRYWSPELKSVNGKLSTGQKAVRKIIHTPDFKSLEHFNLELIRWINNER